MRTFVTLLILIPALCFGGENLIFNTDLETGSKAKVVSSDDQKTSVNFSLSGLRTEAISLEGREYTKVMPLESELEEFGFIAEEGLPDLPVYSSMMIIPDQAGVRVNILSYEYETYEDVDIPPFQPFRFESGEQELSFVIDESFYQRDRFYPEKIVEAGEPNIMRDFRFVQTVIHPVQYNPVRNEMRVYTSVNYELVYEGFDDRNVKLRNDDYISEAFLPLYENLFDNAEEILTDYIPRRGGYLIISADACADTAELIARWKHLKGYYVEIITATDISPGGNPTSSQIKSTIQNAYNTWEPQLDYVLLIGDAEGVSTTFKIAAYYHSGDITDHTYSLLEGGDYEPDVFVARMSVSNLTQFRTIVHKTLGYEMTPDMANPLYLKRGLCVAGNCCGSPTPTTPRLTNLWVRQTMLDHGYVYVDTVFQWSGQPTPPNHYRISGAINDGVSLVTYRGWGGSSGWSYPSWHTSDIYALTNGWKLGVMASIVCNTGDFASSECFGEAWIRVGSPTLPKGGVGFYGPSNYWTYTAWNNTILIGLASALLETDNYHLGSVLVAGKQLMRKSFSRISGYRGWSWYYHIYNALGDPELSMHTDTPQRMTVDYPSSIPVGTNFLSVHVDGRDGLPLEGAYVNLVKGYGVNEEIFVGGWSDAEGNVIFDFQNYTADTLFVTVTYRNYIPHMDHCRVMAQPVALGADSLVIDDDDTGGSSGNDDGNVNPHETLGLSVRLRNFGDSQNATGVSADMTSLDNRATVTVSHQTYPDIAYGSSAFGDGQFIVELDPDIPHGENILLHLSVNASEGDWEAIVSLEVNSIKPASIEVSYPGNPNNRLDPGETSNMVVSFENAGGLGGHNITGQLTCGDPYITIVDGIGQFGDVGIGGTGDNSGSPFSVEVSGSAYDGRNVNFTVNFTADMNDMEDVEFEKTFSVVIGIVDSFDPVGPDNYGYYMYDNTDMNYEPAPIYDWIEINPSLGGQGTRLTFPNSDDASALINMPFDFVYYGESYSHIIACINGFISPDTVHIDIAGNYWYNFDNYPIPDPGCARAQISPFWDDLKYIGSTNGVYTYYDGDNDRFIIEWSGMTHSNTDSPETFQVIIYDPIEYPTPTGDCEIVFQYHTINNNDGDTSNPRKPETYSSVGLENWDEDDGLQYEYDNVYHPGAATLQNGRAIKITTNTGLAVPPDMSYYPDSFTLNCQPGEQVQGELVIVNNGDGTLVYTIYPEAIEGLMHDTGEPKPLNSDGKNEAVPSLPTTNPEKKPLAGAAKKDDFDGDYNPPVILDEGGPDDFGYRWIDSNEPGGPVYNWIDISTIGAPISFSGSGDEGMATGLSIGFSFPFYENVYNTINVCTNGYATFTSTTIVYNNTTIPNSAQPNNMLAVYWDDLNFDAGGNAYIYTNNVDTCIIAFVGVPHYQNDGSFTFEIIMLGSGRIIYQYQEATGPDVNQETIGIENISGTDGLQVVYWAPYVVPGLAVEFFFSPRWLTVDPTYGVVEPHTQDTVIVTCDAAELEEGQYEGILYMATNDSDYPSVDIPVSFIVSSGGCPYVPGDANGDGNVMGNDVTYGVRYFKGLGASPPDSCPYNGDWLYSAGDANGNCAFTGSDVTFLVGYFKGFNPEIFWCPDTPPAGGILPLLGNSREKPVIKSIKPGIDFMR